MVASRRLFDRAGKQASRLEAFAQSVEELQRFGLELDGVLRAKPSDSTNPSQTPTATVLAADRYPDRQYVDDVLTTVKTILGGIRRYRLDAVDCTKPPASEGAAAMMELIQSLNGLVGELQLTGGRAIEGWPSEFGIVIRHHAADACKLAREWAENLKNGWQPQVPGPIVAELEDVRDTLVRLLEPGTGPAVASSPLLHEAAQARAAESGLGGGKNPSADDGLTVTNASKMTGLTTGAISRLANKGTVKSIGNGHQRRIDRASLEGYMIHRPTAGHGRETNAAVEKKCRAAGL